MLEFYVLKLAIHLSWVGIFVASIVGVRKRTGWQTIAQCVGSGMLVVWVLVDWVLFDPSIGLFAGDSPGWVARWVTVQSWICAVGMILFSLGYLFSKLRPDAGKLRP